MPFDPDAYLSRSAPGASDRPPPATAPTPPAAPSSRGGFDPDAYLTSATRETAPSDGQRPGVIGDIVRTLPSKAVEGAVTSPGMIADISRTARQLGQRGLRAVRGYIPSWVASPERVERALADEPLPAWTPTGFAERYLPSSRDIRRGVEEATGAQFYQPRTPAGRFVGDIAETAANPLLVAAGPGTLAARIGSNVLSSVGGVTGERIGERIGGVPGAIVGNLAGTLAGGSTLPALAARRAAQRAATSPRELAKDLRMAGERELDVARTELRIPMAPADINATGRMIRALVGEETTQTGAPQTYRVIRELERSESNSTNALLDAHQKFDAIEQRAKTESERTAAITAMWHVEERMAEVAQQAPETRRAMDAFFQGQNALQRSVTAQRLTDAVERARRKPGPKARNLRAELEHIIADERNGLTDRQRDALRNLSDRDHLLRMISDRDYHGMHWILPAVAALSTYNPWPLAAGATVAGARAIDRLRMQGPVERLRDEILQGWEEGQIGVEAPPSESPTRAAAREVTQQIPPAVLRALSNPSLADLVNQQREPLRVTVGPRPLQ